MRATFRSVENRHFLSQEIPRHWQAESQQQHAQLKSRLAEVEARLRTEQAAAADADRAHSFERTAQREEQLRREDVRADVREAWSLQTLEQQQAANMTTASNRRQNSRNQSRC